MELLTELYKTYSPSGKEKGMRKFLIRWIKENCPTAHIQDDELGNLYITKGRSETYPCLVAHMDQVQKIHSKDFEVLYAEGILFGYSRKNKRPEGLGADDKNGLWVCLRCLEKYDHIKLTFFVQEEIGCRGSQKAVMAFYDDCRFVLQIDRRGENDFITNIGGWTPLCSKEFVEAVQPALFGYKEENGMMTDVEALKENGLKVSAANISCGYYNPHTDTEFTLWAELNNCLSFVKHIIETCLDVYPHEQEEYDYLWQCEYEKEIEEEYFSDLISYYLQNHPNIKAKDIVQWHEGEIYYLTEEDFDRLINEEKRRALVY